MHKKKLISLVLVVGLSVTTIPTLSAEAHLFQTGSTESKVLNCLKIGAGTLAIISTYKQNFLLGSATCFAGIACLANVIKGLEKDIDSSKSVVEKTTDKINETFNKQNMELALANARIRIKNAYNALFK